MDTVTIPIPLDEWNRIKALAEASAQCDADGLVLDKHLKAFSKADYPELQTRFTQWSLSDEGKLYALTGFKAYLDSIGFVPTTGTAVPATPAPPTPAPTPATPINLLTDTGWKEGFTIKGREVKKQVVKLTKGTPYAIAINLKSATDGGVWYHVYDPTGNAKAGEKLGKTDVSNYTFTPAVTGDHVFALEANDGVCVFQPSTTLTPA
jgi:hypothetical protein